MLHFVDKRRCFGDEVQDFVSVALSVYGQIKVLHCHFRQEMAHWVDWEVDSNDFIIFLHLDVACISLEEFVYWHFREGLNLFAHRGEYDCKLVNQDEDVESFSHLALKGVFGERGVYFLLSSRVW